MTQRNEAVRLVHVAGYRIRMAVRAGDGTRTPLLLMNGIGAALETFQPLVDALDPALEVIRFDVPGVGGSPLPPRPYRFPSLCRLLGRALDDLGYSQIDVLGISWGGGLAQQFALTERRRCRRLVLVSTGTGALMVPASPGVLVKMVSPRRYRDPGYMTSIAPHLYGGSVRRDPDRLRDLLHGFARRGDGRGYALQLAAGAGWTSVPFLPLLPQRTLVLTGDDDPIIPQINGRILAGLIRRSTLHVYPGGHVELVVNPGLLVPMIETFLSAGEDRAPRRQPFRKTA
ncbi:MAG TPA: poly(3-hydroxyalkanoate) depolymerase [Kribbellaceae bacterium]